MTSASPTPPGAKERSPVHQILRTGLRTAALLILTMIAALVAANRIPALEAYALERNAAFFTLFVLVSVVPVVRYLKRPRLMIGSAMIGWVLFVGAYDIAGHFFRNLFDVLRTPLELLLEGAVVYGVCAVGSWVVGMIYQARHHPIATRRKRPAP